MANRDQHGDRTIGKLWEQRFVEVIIPLGFSADSISGGLVDDKMIWDLSGNEIYVQIRHKDSYFDREFRHCYGYERYRLNKDMEFLKSTKTPAIYVIHDYIHVGRNSDENRQEDWYAQTIGYLYDNVDCERNHRTYYGDSFEIMSVCYWQVWRFRPLTEILNSLIRVKVSDYHAKH